jgi:hypothetical protein
MKEIITKHLGDAILQPQPGTIIKNAPKVDEFWIPFLADTPPG